MNSLPAGCIKGIKECRIRLECLFTNAFFQHLADRQPHGLVHENLMIPPFKPHDFDIEVPRLEVLHIIVCQSGRGDIVVGPDQQGDVRGRIKRVLAASMQEGRGS